jgi:integrase
MVNANPVGGLRQVRLPQQHPRALSRTEFPQLLSAIDNKEYRALVIVAVCTAMRAGEIAALRWTDVDLGSGVIHLVNREGFRLKSLRARDVPLSRRATLALRSLLRRSERVFVKKRGTPSTPHGHSVWFKKYVRLASLPEDVHFHTLRHTGASMMVENNVPLPFIREILGHSSITTTMIYAHNAASHLRESVLRLDPIVGS